MELLEDMVDSMPAGVLLLAPDGTIIEANPKAYSILGNIERGRRFDKMLQSHVINSDSPNILPLARDQKASKIVVTQNTMANGCMVVAIHDITEHDLDTLSQAEASKMEAIGQVAARLAHQMRTPLAVALLNAEKIQRRSQDAGIRADADNLLTQIATLNQRVNALLQFVRGSSPKRSLFAVAPAIQQVIDAVSPAAQQLGASLSLATSTPVQLLGNPDEFSGAMMSILENALEADAKTVIVSIIESEGIATIEVLDNGKGLPEDLAMRVTEPFVTTKQHGTGLGLSIAQEAFARLGGGLRIVPNRFGTRVICTATCANNAIAQHSEHDDTADTDR